MSDDTVYSTLAALGRPAKVGELMRELRMTKTQVQAALRRLVADGRVTSEPVPPSPFANGGKTHAIYRAVQP